MYTFVNNDIYNAIPSEIKNAIIDTTVVSGHGSTSGETNFTSTDKLYLLSTAEVWAQGSSNTIGDDTARDVTRQLDYYKNLGVTTSNGSGAIKKNVTSATNWSISVDTAKDLTRTLDYYTNIGVTTSSYSGAIKKNGTSAQWWWLRAANSNSTYIFLIVNNSGDWASSSATSTYGVAPAFRLG